jgi:hypothetical protein
VKFNPNSLLFWVNVGMLDVLNAVCEFRFWVIPTGS